MEIYSIDFLSFYCYDVGVYKDKMDKSEIERIQN